MTQLPHFKVLDNPFSSQKLTSLHWECYEAVKTDSLAELVAEGKISDSYLVKALSDLESHSLIQTADEKISYRQWKKSHQGDTAPDSPAEGQLNATSDQPASPTDSPKKVTSPQSPGKTPVPMTPQSDAPPSDIDNAASVKSTGVAETATPVNADTETIDVKEVRKKARTEQVSLDF